MIKYCNTWRLARVFFDYPTTGFLLRELSKITGLGLPSIKLHIKRLEELGIVEKRKDKPYPRYYATRNEIFKFYKLSDLLIRLKETGLIDFLVENFLPDVIVLFGSAARGEDIEKSDIDIFLVAERENVELEKFERELKRRIELHFAKSLKELPHELLNSIINGIVLYGFLEVFE